ncbi:MAG TPA: histidine phosphatase family protein [Pirellulaceae bacterium]|nr:histidine phosphatase family protein [Pirellulaceae bacterium]HMO92092.1 histidine phosphatase family protein [Pirellulaceae bacterium]HMP69320.1 histidine phosphatase family protein [Pirellulaceae bacterium]
MLRLLLVRPGLTDFDEQKRIKGALDMPLNVAGLREVEQAVLALAQEQLDLVYSSPCRAAVQTAELLAKQRDLRVKVAKDLRNLDRGLWSGKTIEEMKNNQPTIYRQWLENPESICPPGGETIGEARERVAKFLAKLLRKHRNATIALVVSEPLLSIIRLVAKASDTIGNLWEVECCCSGWEWIEVPSK